MRVDAANPGDEVLVTNGLYATGGKVMAGDLTNRVALDKAITVQSVNGPWVTIIQGAWDPTSTNGPGAVRCAWLTNGATLAGFTLQRGATRSSGDATTFQGGGGVWGISTNATVLNCRFLANSAYNFGGGAFGVTLKRCQIMDNIAGTIFHPGPGGGAFECSLFNCAITGNRSFASGGGVAYSTLVSCTVSANKADSGSLGRIVYGGGALSSQLTNCIVFGNYDMASSAGNYSSSTLSYCCAVPLPPGPGNIADNPQLLADGVHISAASPCRGAGTNNVVSGTDIDGQAWVNPPSIGCDEWQPDPVVDAPTFQVGLGTGNLNFNALAAGQTPFTFFWYKDGTLIRDNAHYSASNTPNLIVNGFGLDDTGLYRVVASNAFGVATSQVARVVIHCVAQQSPAPNPPYTNWQTAATTIQDAVDEASVGDIVLVTNGLYAVGGKSIDGVITNRVSVDKAITVQSGNGPEGTVIQGALDPTSTNGPGAVRCVWLANNASLRGFTLRGGATRADTVSPDQSMNGGGVLGASTNALVYNCVIEANFAGHVGGGACSVTLDHCSLTGNHAVGSGRPGVGGANAGSGGGAASCNLKNCFVLANFADQSDGGGVQNCSSTNCAFVGNHAALFGSAAYQGVLINCTASENVAGGYATQSGAVANAVLTNCVVYGNFTLYGGLYTNYYSCTFAYCDTDPLPSGNGNIDVDPQLLPDGVHLAETSPCIGLGTAGVTSGTDIDGQSWSNPPSMGCDEWQPVPVIGAQTTYQVETPAHGLTFNVIAAGQTPFSYFWTKDGELIQDDGHYADSATANLVVNHFGPDDAGGYQVVVSNAFGAVTSQVAQVVIHCVDAAGVNPVSPYTSWATAATNIQDAIDAVAANEIVLVTNGLYASGGKTMDGNVTNRVSLDKPVIVTSVNGYAATVIQGAWDPATTNGPLAVRCGWLTNGAVLNGFTLRDGATRVSGGFTGDVAAAGGGAWCASTNGVVSNCVLTNNSATYGGGIANGTLNNSLVVNNYAGMFGGGAFDANLNNCTIYNNYTVVTFQNSGAGTYNGVTRNSIVSGNYDGGPNGAYSLYNLDNYGASGTAINADYAYCCVDPPFNSSLPFGPGIIATNAQFLDLFHISSTSPCVGTGSPLYATGTDLDGEPWANPPSIGCDEVIRTNLVGPLSVSLAAYQTNLLVNHFAYFSGAITGRASHVAWSFGDGPTVANLGAGAFHLWTNAGDYDVIFTAYNEDHTAGVSTNVPVHVEPVLSPLLQSPAITANGFEFQFPGQDGVTYDLLVATNLAPPIIWKNQQSFYATGGIVQVKVTNATNPATFYRILAH